MAFFHYTQLEVGEPRPDEVLCTTPARQSFYWRSVFAPHAYEIAAREMRDRHPRAEEALVREAAGKAYLERCLREVLFESVRVSIDPDLPSRSECLFLFPTPRPAVALDLEDRALLEIAPLPDARLFPARAALLDGSFLAHDMTERAREYWAGANGDADEVLLIGRFRVVRVVEAGKGLTIDGRTFVELHQSVAGHP